MPKFTTLAQLLADAKTTKGTWKLSPDHSLTYKEDGSKKEIKLDANLIAAEAGALVFSYTDKISAAQSTTRIFKIDGAWRLDEANRITFEVEKETGKNDVLAFNGSWELNDCHEILYTYTRRQLKTKTKQTQELLIKGHWDVSDNNRLTYYVGGDTDNAFHFKGSFVRAQGQSAAEDKAGEVRYEIGLDVKGRRRVQTVALFGEWKVSRDLSLNFEYECGEDIRTIGFGGKYRLTPGRDIAVHLISKAGRPLGVEVVLTQDVFGKDGQAFVRLRRSLEEGRVEAGVKFRW